MDISHIKIKLQIFKTIRNVNVNRNIDIELNLVIHCIEVICIDGGHMQFRNHIRNGTAFGVVFSA